MILEAGRSRSAVSASRPETQESWWHSWRPKVVYWRILLLVGGPVFVFYSGLQLLGWGPSTLQRATCSTNWMLFTFKNTLAGTPQITFDQYLGIHDPINLAHITNCHHDLPVTEMGWPGAEGLWAKMVAQEAQSSVERALWPPSLMPPRKSWAVGVL